ncbi:hypothetical protein BVRB_013040 [Beta vulgaris subsp. vulgaris]|uniref:F-box associated beta-propeller type 1 domain-containing protein n=1 Tax=Beta vulgaris subsp. vulgaris TaxID=3555 RepID=A0A0J8B1Y0_BETVV|nr:hypothetical protein BVRB_013040 [Beta vulgaris subsp. vulgaris]
MHIIGHVNGIYCIFHRLIPISGGTLILWNPATRSYKHILPPVSFPFPLYLQHGFASVYDCGDEVCRPEGFHFGFGYDHTIKDYKVVVICHWISQYKWPSDEFWHVRVYNNANDLWTNICCLKYCFYSFGEDVRLAFPYIVSDPEFCNNFIHGACHWSGVKRDEHKGEEFAYCVLVFSMVDVDHSFKVMGGPPILYDNSIQPKMSVWVFKETICFVARFVEKENIEVWIMKEYGVEDSWDLHVSIATQTLDPEFGVVGISDDERIFLGDNNGRLVSYGLHDNQVEENNGVQVKPLESYNGTLGVFNYVESLSPINPPTNSNQPLL